MENWEHKQEPRLPAQTVLERLAGQALRAQRIVIAKRLLGLEQMVNIHAPALAKQPGGAAQVARLKKQFAEAREKLLRGETHG